AIPVVLPCRRRQHAIGQVLRGRNHAFMIHDDLGLMSSHGGETGTRALTAPAKCANSVLGRSCYAVPCGRSIWFWPVDLRQRRLRSATLGQRAQHDVRDGTAPARVSVTLDDDRVEAEAPAVLMEREDHLQHEEEEIGPRPLALGIVEPKPQIEDLQRTDDAPEADEDAEDQ